MQAFPHHYYATANGMTEGIVTVSSHGLPELATTAPREFDGPGGFWSPETLLTAAVANCFILTFRAVAKASNFVWDEIECDVTGVLDRVERVTRFTEMRIAVDLTIPATNDAERAHQLLEKAEKACLISNSLNAKSVLTIRIAQPEFLSS